MNIIRHSGIQKEILALYRAFMREVRNKPVDSRQKIREVIQQKFQEKKGIKRSNFNEIEYHLEQGHRQLEQFKSDHIQSVTRISFKTKGLFQYAYPTMSQLVNGLTRGWATLAFFAKFLRNSKAPSATQDAEAISNSAKRPSISQEESYTKGLSCIEMISHFIAYILKLLFHIFFDYKLDGVEFRIPSLYHLLTSQYELKNIILQPFYCHGSNATFQVQKGYINKVRFEYPWRNLKFRTFNINLDRIFIFVEEIGDEKPIIPKVTSDDDDTIYGSFTTRLKYWISRLATFTAKFVHVNISFSNIHVIYNYKNEFLATSIKNVSVELDIGEPLILENEVDDHMQISRRIKLREVSIYPIHRREIGPYWDAIKEEHLTCTTHPEEPENQSSNCFEKDGKSHTGSHLLKTVVIDKNLLQSILKEQEDEGDKMKRTIQDYVGSNDPLRQFIHILDTSFAKRKYILHPTYFDVHVTVFHNGQLFSPSQILSQIHTERLILSLEYFPIQSLVHRWIDLLQSTRNDLLKDESNRQNAKSILTPKYRIKDTVSPDLTASIQNSILVVSHVHIQNTSITFKDTKNEFMKIEAKNQVLSQSIKKDISTYQIQGSKVELIHMDTDMPVKQYLFGPSSKDSECSYKVSVVSKGAHKVDIWVQMRNVCISMHMKPLFRLARMINWYMKTPSTNRQHKLHRSISEGSLRIESPQKGKPYAISSHSKFPTTVQFNINVSNHFKIIVVKDWESLGSPCLALSSREMKCSGLYRFKESPSVLRQNKTSTFHKLPMSFRLKDCHLNVSNYKNIVDFESSLDKHMKITNTFDMTIEKIKTSVQIGVKPIECKTTSTQVSNALQCLLSLIYTINFLNDSHKQVKESFDRVIVDYSFYVESPLIRVQLNDPNLSGYKHGDIALISLPEFQCHVMYIKGIISYDLKSESPYVLDLNFPPTIKAHPKIIQVNGLWSSKILVDDPMYKMKDWFEWSDIMDQESSFNLSHRLNRMPKAYINMKMTILSLEWLSNKETLCILQSFISLCLSDLEHDDKANMAYMKGLIKGLTEEAMFHRKQMAEDHLAQYDSHFLLEVASHDSHGSLMNGSLMWSSLKTKNTFVRLNFAMNDVFETEASVLHCLCSDPYTSSEYVVSDGIHPVYIQYLRKPSSPDLNVFEIENYVEINADRMCVLVSQKYMTDVLKHIEMWNSTLAKIQNRLALCDIYIPTSILHWKIICKHHNFMFCDPRLLPNVIQMKSNELLIYNMIYEKDYSYPMRFSFRTNCGDLDDIKSYESSNDEYIGGSFGISKEGMVTASTPMHNLVQDIRFESLCTDLFLSRLEEDQHGNMMLRERVAITNEPFIFVYISEPNFLDTIRLKPYEDIKTGIFVDQISITLNEKKLFFILTMIKSYIDHSASFSSQETKKDTVLSSEESESTTQEQTKRQFSLDNVLIRCIEIGKFEIRLEDCCDSPTSFESLGTQCEPLVNITGGSLSYQTTANATSYTQNIAFELISVIDQRERIKERIFIPQDYASTFEISRIEEEKTIQYKCQWDSFILLMKPLLTARIYKGIYTTLRWIYIVLKNLPVPVAVGIYEGGEEPPNHYEETAGSMGSEDSWTHRDSHLSQFTETSIGLKVMDRNILGPDVNCQQTHSDEETSNHKDIMIIINHDAMILKFVSHDFIRDMGEDLLTENPIEYLFAEGDDFHDPFLVSLSQKIQMNYHQEGIDIGFNLKNISISKQSLYPLHSIIEEHPLSMVFSYKHRNHSVIHYGFQVMSNPSKMMASFSDVRGIIRLALAWIVKVKTTLEVDEGECTKESKDASKENDPILSRKFEPYRAHFSEPLDATVDKHIDLADSSIFSGFKEFSLKKVQFIRHPELMSRDAETEKKMKESEYLAFREVDDFPILISLNVLLYDTNDPLKTPSYQYLFDLIPPYRYRPFQSQSMILKLHSRYYNHQLGVWDPILDRPIQLKVMYKDSSLTIQSEDPFELNITKPLISSLSQSIQRWIERKTKKAQDEDYDEKSTESNEYHTHTDKRPWNKSFASTYSSLESIYSNSRHTDQEAPTDKSKTLFPKEAPLFFIENKTGCKMKYVVIKKDEFRPPGTKLSYNDLNHSRIEPMIGVESFEDYMMTSRVKDAFSFAEKKYEIRVVIADLKELVIQEEKVGRYVEFVEGHRILYEVLHRSNGSKIFRFASPYLLVNKTQIPIDIAIFYAGEQKAFPTIRPQKSFVLPLPFTSFGRICCKPSILNQSVNPFMDENEDSVIEPYESTVKPLFEGKYSWSDIGMDLASLDVTPKTLASSMYIPYEPDPTSFTHYKSVDFLITVEQSKDNIFTSKPWKHAASTLKRKTSFTKSIKKQRIKYRNRIRQGVNFFKKHDETMRVKGIAKFHHDTVSLEKNANQLPEVAKSTVNKQFGFTRIQFSPPMVIDNLLLIPISVHIYMKGSKEESYTIPFGESLGVYHHERKDQLKVVIQMEGYKPKRHFAINRMHKLDENITFVSKKNGSKLRVCVEKVEDKSGIRRFYLYCPIWIHNMTSIPLQVFIDDEFYDKLDEGNLDELYSKEFFKQSTSRDSFINTNMKKIPPNKYNSILMLGTSSRHRHMSFRKKNTGNVQSEQVPLNGILATYPINVKAKSATSMKSHKLALTIKNGRKQFWRTRVFTIHDPCIFWNSCNHPIFIRHYMTNDVTLLASNEHKSIDYWDPLKPDLLEIRVQNTEWSKPLAYLREEPMVLTLLEEDRKLQSKPLQSEDLEESEETMMVKDYQLNLFIHQTNEMTIIKVSDVNKYRPHIQIINYTPHRLRLWQKDTLFIKPIERSERISWGWIDPSKDRVVLVEMSDNAESYVMECDLEKIQVNWIESKKKDHYLKGETFTLNDVFYLKLTEVRGIIREGSSELEEYDTQSQAMSQHPMSPFKGVVLDGVNLLSEAVGNGGENTGFMDLYRSSSDSEDEMMNDIDEDIIDPEEEVVLKQILEEDSMDKDLFPARSAYGSSSIVSHDKTVVPTHTGQFTEEEYASVAKRFSMEDYSSYRQHTKASKRTKHTKHKLLGKEEKPLFNLKLNFANVGFSLVNEVQKELIYVLLGHASIQFQEYAYTRSLDFRVKAFQIDSTCQSKHCPPFISTIVDRKNLEKENLNTRVVNTSKDGDHGKTPKNPFLDPDDEPLDIKFSICHDKTHVGIIYLDHLFFTMKDVYVHLEEAILAELLDFFGFTIDYFIPKGHPMTSKAQHKRTNVYLKKGKYKNGSSFPLEYVLPFTEEDILNLIFDSMVGYGVLKGPTLYLKSFYIKPITMLVEFLITSKKKESQISVILGVPRRFLSNVNDAPISLNGLWIHDTIVPLSDLWTELSTHYSLELYRQIYTIIGCFESLGSPMIFFTNVGSGLVDLFVEPTKGFLGSDGRSFKKGLRIGGASFCRKMVYAFFNSASTWLKNMGTGISIFTLDPIYQRHYTDMKSHFHVYNALDGLKEGMKEWYDNTKDGWKGVVVKPKKGYHNSGFPGAVQGMGKGLVGVVTKPFIGVVDVFQRVCEGTKNMAREYKVVKRKKKRAARFIAPT